jgi:hypothetical protein
MNWLEEYQKFLEKQVEPDKVFFYIQNSYVREEYAVVKILEEEFFYRIVYSETNPDSVGNLNRNIKKNIWEMNNYDFSLERKYGVS